LGEYYNGCYDYSLHVWIENMNIPKYIVHFEYSLDILNGLGTIMLARKLIHTLKLTSDCEWKELSYLKVSFVIK
jgi:hypothetical protein